MLAHFLQMLSKAPICLHRHPAVQAKLPSVTQKQTQILFNYNQVSIYKRPTILNFSAISGENKQAQSKSAKNSA